MPIVPCIQLALTLLLALAVPCSCARLSSLSNMAGPVFLVSGQAQIYTDKLEVWVWKNRVRADICGCNIIHQISPCTDHKMHNILPSKGSTFLSFLSLHYASISRWLKNVGGSDPEHSFELDWCHVIFLPL